MNEQSPYERKYIDHFIQADIIGRLVMSATPLRFSQLKEDGVENSLFMYHANKLLRRGVIEKAGDKGFALTRKGARWANLTGATIANPKPLPRPLVQFLIHSGGALLLARRKGSLGELLNKYMLPGGLHIFGKTADETARVLLEGYYERALETKFITEAEIITEDDEFTHHVISHIFKVELTEQIIPQDHELFAYEWHALDDITGDNPDFTDTSTLFFANNLRENSFSPREFIRQSVS
jgi:hypothetical protein